VDLLAREFHREYRSGWSLLARTGRNHKIGYSADRIDDLLALESHPVVPEQVVLDLDPTDTRLRRATACSRRQKVTPRRLLAPEPEIRSSRSALAIGQSLKHRTRDGSPKRTNDQTLTTTLPI
jgi:hypothetical protein